MLSRRHTWRFYTPITVNLIASGNRKRFSPPIDADTPGDFCFFSVEIFCDVIDGNLDLTLNGGSGQKGQSGGRGSKGRDNGLGVREPFVIYLLLSSVNTQIFFNFFLILYSSQRSHLVIVRLRQVITRNLGPVI